MRIAVRGGWAGLALVAMVSAAFADSSGLRDDSRSTGMDVYGYAIEGRVLLNAENFTRVIAPFVGRHKTAADIERTRDALQRAYHDLGHCSVKVMLARPEPQDGVVRFRLVEVPAGEIRECLPVSTAQTPVGAETKIQVAAANPKSLETLPGVMVSPNVEGGGRELVLSGDGLTPGKSPVAILAASDRAATSSAPAAQSSAVIPATLPTTPAPESKPVAPVPNTVLAQSEPARPAPNGPAKETPAPVTKPATPPADLLPLAPIAAPKFEILRYLAEGNTLLTQEKLDQVLAPFTGKNKDFGDVQRALEALQAAYQAAGYGGVEVRLPEQELERGEVRFTVIEVKIGKITVEGNQHFSSHNIRRSVPSLREGVTPNSRQIAESIRLANESPAKQSAVLLRGSEREDQIDAVIRVTDIDPKRSSASFDNTGTQNTGRARLGIAYQHANVFDRDHVFTAQFITSPTKYQDVNVVGAGYKIPFYSLGDSIEFVAGYSKVDSGTVQDLFQVSGQGAIYGVRYNHSLPKWRDLEHKLIYGLDYRAYQNLVTPTGTQNNLVPDITVHPFSLTYSASLRTTGQDLSFYLNMAQNIPGGNDGVDEDFKQPGARFQVGTAGYRLFRAGFNYVRVLKDDYQFRVNFSSQYTDDALVAPEQFGVGGADNVRGFNERYVSNDKGYRSSWEIYTPDVAKAWRLENGRLRFLAFYDTAAVYRNYRALTEKEAAHLDSGGIGLRWNYKNYYSARLDIAHVFHDGSGFSEPDNRRNIKKLHFSMAWVW